MYLLGKILVLVLAYPIHIEVPFKSTYNQYGYDKIFEAPRLWCTLNDKDNERKITKSNRIKYISKMLDLLVLKY